MFQCARCGGSGKTAWKHVEDGVCFACDGTGEVAIEPKAPSPVKTWKVAEDHTDALAKLRTLYKIARERGTTYEDAVEAATGVTLLLDMAPETRPHFRALGWNV